MQQVEIVAASCKKGKNYWGTSLVAGTSGFFFPSNGASRAYPEKFMRGALG
jgi:hypothetical protein